VSRPATLRSVAPPAGVLHVVDTLARGGLERVAVNLVNALPADRFQAHLCTTRREGPLEELVSPAIGRLRLHRAGRFDPGAVRRLVSYVATNDIRLIHAHGTSLFLAVVTAAFRPHPAVVWHDHFGRFEHEKRSVRVYRPAVRRTAAVIAVTEALAEWSRRRLGARPDRVFYVPNLILPPETDSTAEGLPGRKGSRVVCVANFRRQKDHLGLVLAFASILRQRPEAHLLLVGAPVEPETESGVRRLLSREGLDRSVSLLGSRNDVPGILRACDVGVLGSLSEGFPLSLVEYGWARLPVVATRVGQCEEILDGGEAGVLVPPAAPEALAKAILDLLGSAERRNELGQRLRARVESEYGPERSLQRICDVYQSVLGGARPAWAAATS
jgi:glycosyltransferase involved in cell wall biosynthesis